MVANAFSQASLDAYNSFGESQIPLGWTYFLDVSSGSYFYAGGSDETPSARLDATGEYIMVQFAEKPHQLSYFIRSTGIGTPVAPGTTFTVQQSVNGVSWTSLRVLNTTNLSGNFIQFTDDLLPNVRYVRFFYTNKASGSNIALDEILVQKAAPGPEACLMIYRNGEKVLADSEIEFSSEEGLMLEFANEGLIESLDISSINWSGSNAADFSFNVIPNSIPAAGSQFVNINVNGQQGQTYQATFTVNSNDDYNFAYPVNCVVYGGNLAPEPNSSAQNFQFYNLTTWKFDLAWQSASGGAEGYLVLQNVDNVVNSDPLDGVQYQVGNYLGSSKVVYSGNGLGFTPTFIGAGRSYHFKIYAYNGNGVYRNYKQSNPLVGEVTTPTNMIGSYYTGLNAQQSSFSMDLTDKLFPHNQVFYDEYINTLIDNFEARDTTNSQRAVSGYYTGYEHVYEGAFSWDVLSREHVFPHSWFASYPAFEDLEYSDFHNLFPVHNDSANLVRSNLPFGIVVSPTQEFLEGKLGLDAQGNLVYEPRDFAKGKVARAMFYMAAAYNNQVAGPWQLILEQNQQLLKNWHFQNPPGSREKARNDYIYLLQGNRNAFIDSVHYACYLDFYTMSYIENPPGWCVALSNSENNMEQPTLFPNPSTGIVNVHFPALLGSANFSMTDATGKEVWRQTSTLNGRYFQTDFSHLHPGFYTLRWQNTNSSGVLPVLLQ